MPALEKICQRMIGGTGFWNKILIGGFISFVPILNLLALGYLYRYSFRLRRTGDLALPEWTNEGALYMTDGLRLFFILVPFCFLPLFLAAGLSCLLKIIFVGLWLHPLAYTIAFFPFGMALAVTPALSMSALYQYQTEEDWESLLEWRPILNRLNAALPYLVIPSLAFAGAMTIGLGFFGFAFFLGFAVLAAYYNVVFTFVEKQRLMEPL